MLNNLGSIHLRYLSPPWTKFTITWPPVSTATSMKQRLPNGTKVRHRVDGFVGHIDGLTQLCKGPKRNPDGVSQYRIRIVGQDRRELAAEEDLVILHLPTPKQPERFGPVQSEKETNCWSCKKFTINSSDRRHIPGCGWVICPLCGACGCDFSLPG